MTILEWYGQIGWDLWLPQLRAQLKNAGGEDVTIRFSSVGGSIFEGSDIFNMIADHKRDNPNIQMNLEVKAIAASMASAIAASPAWDNISVEPTSWLMIHNPANVAWGDFRVMQDEADFLEKARDMWAGVYAAKSGVSLEEAQQMMNDTTWLFGQEIIDAGFADEMNDAAESNVIDKTMSMRQMKSKFSEMKKKQRDLSEDEGFDKQRAVACLKMDSSASTEIPEGAKPPASAPPTTDLDRFNEEQDTAGSSSNKNLDQTGMNQTEVPSMEKAELKEKYPAIYDETVQDGVAIERTRVKALTDMKALDEYKDISEVCAAIDKAIEDGKTPNETQSLVMAVMVKIVRDPAQSASLESPPDIEGSDSAPAMQTTEKIREV